MITAQILQQAFQQMKEEEEEASMTALAYFPHIIRLYGDAAALPERSLKRLAEHLNRAALPPGVKP